MASFVNAGGAGGEASEKEQEFVQTEQATIATNQAITDQREVEIGARLL